ncbi:M18 family aminopeptidase [Butyrivibrio sp. VCD2006]|uniref:M18 family aminopeptidase n=1 Tax=Butyrivibrio sp. VCD2006 TaxID=1280664 RepID=UPI0003FD23BB|nr:M18 family aminopeptidase [Butyrivibrio sp. VCD2006]
MKKSVKGLTDFIWKSPTAYHAVDNLRARLLDEGFTELSENENWKLKKGGNYFVTRGGSSIISFKLPKDDYKGFYMIASHSDSPSFKIKENPEIESAGAYVTLNVEKYGGMLCAPWFDRPLSVAGRVIVKKNSKDGAIGFDSKLVDVGRNLVMLPSLAIHMDREANDGHKYNAQKDMLPIFGDEKSKDKFMTLIAKAAGVKEKDIISHDLFLYNRVEPTVWGAADEYVSAGRLDDLECCYGSFEGFIGAENKKNVIMHVVFDNEEVGSTTRQGAASTFLKDTLERISESFSKTKEDYLVSIANSFMVSADNAHAVHPNYVEKADPVNRPQMNKGIVIKYNANQKYTTDAVSGAICKMVCEKAGVPYQTFTNRSDVAGGSTLGNISGTQVALRTVDIGMAQLAMHSPYETAGVQDVDYLIDFSKEFYSSDLQ